MKLVIIEDELDTSEHLCQLVKSINEDYEILATLRSVKESLDWFKKNDQPDLILVDIQLQDGTCFSIFENATITASVVFVTSFDQYAIEAFKHNSIGYLLKPVNKKDLEEVFNKYYLYARLDSHLILEELKKISNPSQGYKNRLISKVNSNIHILEVEDINFIHSKFGGVFATMSNQKHFLLNYSLTELEEILDPKKFFRVNRKYIASIKSIESVTTYSSSRMKVVIKGCDDRVLVPKEKTSSFKSWLES